MKTTKTLIEAERVRVVVPLTASPGDYLLIVGGVCIGVEGGPVESGNGAQPPFKTSNKKPPKEKPIQAEYLKNHLLETLYDLKDPTPTKKVLAKIEPRIAPKLKAVDYEKLQSGDARWRNKVQWARFLAVKEGLMEKDAERGMWQLSDAGRHRVEKMRQQKV